MRFASFALMCLGVLNGLALMVHAQEADPAKVKRWERLSSVEKTELRARFERFQDLEVEEQEALRRRARNLRIHRDQAGAELELIDPNRWRELQELEEVERSQRLRPLVVSRLRLGLEGLRRTHSDDEMRRVRSMRAVDRREAMETLLHQQIDRSATSWVHRQRDAGRLDAQRAVELLEGSPQERSRYLRQERHRGRSERLGRHRSRRPGFLSERGWQRIEGLEPEELDRIWPSLSERWDRQEIGLPEFVPEEFVPSWGERRRLRRLGTEERRVELERLIRKLVERELKARGVAPAEIDSLLEEQLERLVEDAQRQARPRWQRSRGGSGQRRG